MKTTIIFISILILFSCKQSTDKHILKNLRIKKERIIRYKLLPNAYQIMPPFSVNKNDDDTFYEYYYLDSLSPSRIPILNQFQGYKIIETNLTGDTVKTYAFNPYGRLTETKVTISNDSIEFYRTINSYTGEVYTNLIYTSNNIKKEYSDYYRPGSITPNCGWKPDPEWDKMTYLDTNKNPIKITSSFVQNVQSFKYNSKGNIIYYELIELSTGEILGSTTFSYNTNNQLIEEQNHGNNFSMVNKIIYEYKNDTLTQSLHYDIDNNLIFSESTTYEYDSYGNWIKKIKSINSVPRFITEREITYH